MEEQPTLNLSTFELEELVEIVQKITDMKKALATPLMEEFMARGLHKKVYTSAEFVTAINDLFEERMIAACWELVKRGELESGVNEKGEMGFWKS